MNMENIMTARKAIVDDLKRRALAKDKDVIALDPSTEHRWHKPQDNYYIGAGLMDCPVCKNGCNIVAVAIMATFTHAAPRLDVWLGWSSL